MSAISLDYPLQNFQGIPLQEGQRFEGYVHDGKVTMIFNEVETGTQQPTVDRLAAAKHFFSYWAGKGEPPTQEEMDTDPRLAYLVAKHIK